jgi:hypothetical protein
MSDRIPIIPDEPIDDRTLWDVIKDLLNEDPPTVDYVDGKGTETAKDAPP